MSAHHVPPHQQPKRPITKHRQTMVGKGKQFPRARVSQRGPGNGAVMGTTANENVTAPWQNLVGKGKRHEKCRR